MAAVSGPLGTHAPFEQMEFAPQLAVAVHAATQRPMGVQALPAPQSAAAAHSGAGRTQRPRLHTSPLGQSLVATQPLPATQAPALQVCPEPQSRSTLHCGTHLPFEQICALVQSLA